MTDPVDKIVTEALRQCRADTLQAAIDLCEMVAENGGCAFCCIEEIQKMKDTLQASNSASDLMARVFKP